MEIFEDLKFLVVDDQLNYRKLNVECLIELGFKEESIDTAENGEIALKMAKENNYEFFLVDLVMPVMDGLEFVSKITQMDKYKKTPKLILSSTIDKNIVLEVVQAGATNFLVKPPEPKNLADKIIASVEHVNKQ